MNLARAMIERTWRGVTPSRAITAPLAESDPLAGLKLLSDNRDRYIAQSAATVGGHVAPLPPSAADSPGPAAGLTAQPHFFATSSACGPEAGRCETEAGPVAAPGAFDPDSFDVTNDNEPDLPWDGFEADPDMDTPEF